MSVETRRARLMQVKGAKANHERKSVSVLFLGADGHHYDFELMVEAIAPAVIAILGKRDELQISLPPDQELPTQALQASHVTIAMNPVGEVGLRYHLQGGIDMVFQVPPEQLQAMLATIQELVNLAERKSH